MTRSSSSITRNTAANLVRGGATAAVALVLPRFLTRTLDADHFAAWSLILQIAAYASYLDFGLQTTVARFMAQAIELEQEERQAKVIKTAFRLLSLAALFAFALSAAVACLLPQLFHGVPLDLVPQLRTAVLALSFSACALLPLSTYTGVLVGMRRNEIPAAAIGGSRIAGAMAVVVVSHYTQSLTILALCMGIPNLLGGMIQMSAVDRLNGFRSHINAKFSNEIGREILRFCMGLAVWSFAMLLISGLDVTIVGHFQFEAVGFYSIASMLITFFAGMTNSALAALLAPIAALHARNDHAGVLRILLSATRRTLLINLVLTAGIFVCGGWLLRLWVGPFYAARALPVLEILSVAQVLRLAGGPYSIVLISIGEQAKAIPAAICEALVNLVASVLGMIIWGPIGVAWGTFAGATAAIVWIVFKTMPSVENFRVPSCKFIAKAILPAMVPCLPVAFVCLLRQHVSAWEFRLSVVLSTALSVIVVSWWSRVDRHQSDVSRLLSP